MKHDPRIDAYIERKADFAKPILKHLRQAVHAACPAAEETIKWGAPAFIYKGEILAIMAGFKQHVAFNLWRGTQVTGETGKEKTGMGQFGRLTSLQDLPDRPSFEAIIHKAMALADSGVKAPSTKKGEPKSPTETPDDLQQALAANQKAAVIFEGFSPSARREYVEWVADAKQAATRERRIAQAVEWIAEGKKRNWKYEQC
ncbi:MAG: YdeI/OmpD-associated family protein [Sphingosinicella sp.]|nr:YdeI/OmpD-associated family protein [Sphingosinicella sp.]